MQDKLRYSRRQFISTSSIAAAGLLLPGQTLIGAPAILTHYRKPNSRINGVQIGVITYSFRSMKDQSAEATLRYIKECGISAIELMGGPAESFAGMPENPVDRRAFFRLMRKQRQDEALSESEMKELEDLTAQMKSYNQQLSKWRANAPMDKFKQVKQMYNDAGVEIYGFKPRAFGRDNTDAEIDYGFRAAKALGASHVTLEHPSDDAHTLKLGKMAKKHKVRVAYHGHEQQTPTFWDTALKQSKFNMLNPDFGHYVAAGNEHPLDLLKDKHKRISSMHVKDRQTPANGKGNVVWGEGDTPIADILQVMRENKYRFPATIELEYAIPDDSDAVKEVRRCLEFCKQHLTA